MSRAFAAISFSASSTPPFVTYLALRASSSSGGPLAEHVLEHLVEVPPVDCPARGQPRSARRATACWAVAVRPGGRWLPPGITGLRPTSCLVTSRRPQAPRRASCVHAQDRRH